MLFTSSLSAAKQASIKQARKEAERRNSDWEQVPKEEAPKPTVFGKGPGAKNRQQPDDMQHARGEASF